MTDEAAEGEVAEVAQHVDAPPAALATATAPTLVAGLARRRRVGRLGRRPVFRIFQVTHRWVSLVLGLLLLAIVLSGVALLYKHDIHRVLHPSLFRATQTEQPITIDRATAIVRTADPAFTPTFTQAAHGLFLVMDDDAKTYVVDGGTGRINGTMNPNKGVFGFLDNLHECGLTCEGYTGYVAFLDRPINWWIFGEELTWGALILGGVGVLLGFMVLSGLVIWWPGIRSMARGFRVRRRTNRYKLNYDLHKVVGAVALPFLAVWALTGAGFELPVVKDAWYAVLPGSAVDDPPEFKSSPVRGVADADQHRLTEAEAIRLASAKAHGPVLGVTPPTAGDRTSAWSFWVAGANDPYDHGDYPGNVEVHVDQYSGRTQLGYGAPGHTDTVAEDLWEHWSYPLHAGTFIAGPWRIAWLLFGLAPLLLAVTGVTTWWIRSRKARRNRRLRAERAAAKAALGAA